MSDELKNCPHCAEPGIEVEQIRRGDFHEWSIECSGCYCRTDWYGSREAAVAAWNKRADDADEPPLDRLLRCLENDYGILAEWDGLRRVWYTQRAEPLPVDNAQADSRERLEADVRSLFKYQTLSADLSNYVIGLLDRQAAITEREIYKREQFHEKTQDMVEQIETQGIEIDGLIAERDGLRRELETQEHLAGQASRDYLRVLDRADKLQERVDSLTAERDELQSIIDHMPKTEAECEACQEAHDRLMFLGGMKHQELQTKVDKLAEKLDEKQHVCDVQRDSFLEMERENAELRRTVENLRGD